MRTQSPFLRARPDAAARVRLTATALAALGACAAFGSACAQTLLADQPLLSTNVAPGNLALVLSVEYPTATSVAHLGDYSSAKSYLGYFDPAKCYTYLASATDTTTSPNTTTPASYFYPDGAATDRKCSSKWSGNFLNWASMQTIDPFRWALTGGYRVIDTSTLTVLEKAWASGQGGEGEFPNRSLGTSEIAGATPFSSSTSAFNLRIQGVGNTMRFSTSSSALTNGTSPNSYTGNTLTDGKVYETFIRVKVCDSSSTAGGLESNCVAYGSNYKPEGLIQRYSSKIRYSAFGYLNDSSIQRDAGVLRARQKYVGPTKPVPGSVAVTNAASEWDAATGVFVVNPDTTDASDTATLFGVTVSNSGVMNYLNKFGKFSGGYKTYDPVSELYYAAVRYFKNLGNVPAWTAVPSGTSTATKTAWVDGFPVITTWDDPILYSCQSNFILGIGDVNTHADKNVPGTGTPTGNEPTKPAAVVADNSVDAVVATNKVGALEGLGSTLGTTNPYGGCCSNNSALMAGLAYDSHTRDIRPDVSTQANTLGKQTISTYWLDVMEYQEVKSKNQFLLTAKYGGFTIPASGYDTYGNTTPLAQAWWSTTGDTLPDGTPRPDNYYTAGSPDKMVAGLNRAFGDIASKINAYSAAFSTVLPQVSASGTGSYSTRYSTTDWTGEVTGSALSFDASGNPTLVQKWTFTDVLANQASGTGWNTNRRIATWNTATGSAVAFRASGASSISTAQLSALDTSYRSGVDGTDYLNYLRGDRSQEQNSTVNGSSHAYRTRAKLSGDIVGSKARPIGPPSLALSEATNPGYSTFKSTWAARRTVVYVGANDGMMHAVNGALVKTATTPALETDPNAGTEMFAYIPGALYQGPNATPGTDGLASLGNPTFTHKFFVNATPNVYDIDFARTPNSAGTAQTGTPDWRSVLVGGLGKGGRAYYAIDVTDPTSMVSGGEGAVAGKVLWEFTDSDLGYTFGEPVVAKTRKYGWVFVFPSGYNNADGKGYFFVVNPRTGALLEKISTGAGSPTQSAGLAQANGYVIDATDGVMDAVYAGDLLGNIWRLDVSAASGAYPAPTRIATLTDSSNVAQPVTTRPLIELQPGTNKRFVLIGTGRLLDSTDISSSQVQGFYAISDGNAVAFNGGTALPGGVHYPITRATLAQVTDTLQGASFDPNTQMGWYLDLNAAASSGITWRITNEPSTFYGAVNFVATSLKADACTPTGTSRVYSLNFATGKSLVRDEAGNPIAFYEVPANVTDLKDLSVDGKHVIVVGSDKGDVTRVRTDPVPGGNLQRLNWRELPVVD